MPPTSDQTTARPFTPSPHEPLPHQLLAAVAQHRMATTQQLQDLLRPQAARQTISRPLNRLHKQGLIGYTALPHSHGKRAWYLTPDGARITRDWPQLRGRPPYPLTSASAASLKTPHVLTVVRSHLAFVADARRRGDEHGYLDWTPEVAHALGDSERVIADALMYYVRHNDDGSRTKFRSLVEVDRATTSSERLATKLIDYARLHTYTPAPPGRRASQANSGPAWQRWYPVFPRVLFILTGASPVTLTHRIEDLQAMTAEHPAVAHLARTVPLGAAVLHDLEQHGPTGPLWTPLNGQGERRSWTEL
ncbi:replication-relaxation family protein [Streptomyces xanthochromogenes]|uniref:replication-relaxation family protein n=1 Tax=Streptomyces xanthochromogenes TaxID=67384 RepID=UPI001E32D874|nr:replication-relaxation family protein [Streptomyces xanthochromogenes]